MTDRPLTIGIGVSDPAARCRTSSVDAYCHHDYRAPVHGGPGRADRRGTSSFPKREFLGCVVVGVVAIAVELVVAWFVKSKGVALTGDEPSYIIQAQTYLHLSPHILGTIRSDLARNALSAYAPGTPVSAVASYLGPHGMISAFEPGLGILLIPFVATGHLFLGAAVGVITINTAGLILLHRRATRLAWLGKRGQVLLAMLLVAPALLVVTNQIYPDLVSGVVLACALVEVALIERRGSVQRTSTVVLLVAVTFLPWLQIKNFVPAVVVLLAYLVAGRRAGTAWRRLLVPAVVPVVGWALLLLYNHYYYGHLGGLPEPFPRPSVNGLEFTLGLLFDRHQGMFVQVPFALIGLIGLWVARKRLPAAVIATVVSAGAILLLNGTYTSNPYGGLSLAGRFMWTLLPVLLLWTAIVIGRWQRAGRLLVTPVLVVVGAWIYQAVPILAGSHVYYNAYTPTAPWDPATWPGWWTGFNRILPQFDLPGHPLGASSWALIIELAMAALLLIAAWEYMGPDPFPRWSVAAMAVLVVAVVVALVVAEPLYPTTSLRYDARQLGTPVVGGSQGQTSPDVALQGVLPSSYRFTLVYSLDGTAPTASMTVSCNGTDGTVTTEVHRTLAAGRTAAAATVHCTQAGTVASQFGAGPGAVLHVSSLRLARTGP